MISCTVTFQFTSMGSTIFSNFSILSIDTIIISIKIYFKILRININYLILPFGLLTTPQTLNYDSDLVLSTPYRDRYTIKGINHEYWLKFRIVFRLKLCFIEIWNALQTQIGQALKIVHRCVNMIFNFFIYFTLICKTKRY